MDPEIGELEQKLDRLASSVKDLQGLVGATYERLNGGGEAVRRLRDGHEWERAYAEPEPLVSVRIATWDRPELLVEQALASVRRQTYSRWEAVVVGDGCTDDTGERVAAIGDSRIRFHNLPFHGPYPENPVKRWIVAGMRAHNTSLRMAKGSWIAPLDDDDEWEDDHLEVLLGAARAERAELAYGRARCSLNGSRLEKSFGAWPPRQGQINLQSSIYNAALRVFEHDEAARFLGEPSDWNLIRRMWEAGVRFTFVDRIVTTYSVDHLQQLSEERSTKAGGAG